LILGTDKREGEGALFVFDLDGKIVQTIDKMDRPNNVEVIQGVRLGDQQWDIAVVTERMANQLRIFRIDENGRLTDVTGLTKVFANAGENENQPMGIALYKAPTGELFAFVSRSRGPAEGYIHQYQLSESNGKVDARYVRALGSFSGKKEIEALSVDPDLGILYLSDEQHGIHALPIPEANSSLTAAFTFANSGFEGDHEGTAIYRIGQDAGYFIASDQVKGKSRYHIYDRVPVNGHMRLLKIVLGADDTDGLDATSEYLGPRFPNGVLVVMNSEGKNFWIYDWRDIALTGEPKLRLAR
jgi:3-phytase